MNYFVFVSNSAVIEDYNIRDVGSRGPPKPGALVNCAPNTPDNYCATAYL